MKLIMMGTGDFAVPTFQALIERAYPVHLLVTQPDRPQGRHQELIPAAIKRLAIEWGVPVFQPQDINAPQAVGHLRTLDPDLLVVAAYGQILSDELLGVPSHGGINLHASLLPRYRGAAPVNWAIYNGDAVSGVTVIRMSPRVDAGQILLQAETRIGSDETAATLEARLAEIGAPLICQAIDGLQAGTLEGRSQDRSKATRAPKLRKEHGLIDWTRTATQVANQVRAMQPWPMAYTFLHRPVGLAGGRIIIERARAGGSEAECTVPVDPGLVLQASGDDLVVQAGEGAVRIEQVRPAGKKRMTAAEFLRGHRISIGDRFAPDR